MSGRRTFLLPTKLPQLELLIIHPKRLFLPTKIFTLNGWYVPKSRGFVEQLYYLQVIEIPVIKIEDIKELYLQEYFMSAQPFTEVGEHVRSRYCNTKIYGDQWRLFVHERRIVCEQIPSFAK